VGIRRISRTGVVEKVPGDVALSKASCCLKRLLSYVGPSIVGILHERSDIVAYNVS
jgi:hypothetical protein